MDSLVAYGDESDEDESSSPTHRRRSSSSGGRNVSITVVTKQSTTTTHIPADEDGELIAFSSCRPLTHSFVDIWRELEEEEENDTEEDHDELPMESGAAVGRKRRNTEIPEAPGSSHDATSHIRSSSTKESKMNDDDDDEWISPDTGDGTTLYYVIDI